MSTFVRRKTVEYHDTDGGVIATRDGVVFVGGTTTTLTLPDPVDADNGATLKIVAVSASAHTVTNTTGFNAGSTASDVGTFGGALGDNMVVTAYGGVWYVVSLRNVTLG